MNRFAFGLVAVMAACMGVSSAAHGAAALESGAVTSAKPKAKDPVKKQIQIAADPVGIIDFQFSLHWDPEILHVANDVTGLPLVRAINGYQLGVRGNPEAPAYAIDAARGYISVRGFWPVANGEVPYQEIDVYDVVFELNDTWFDGIPLDPNTPFIIYSRGVGSEGNPFGRGNPDRMVAGNIINGVAVPTRVYTAGDVNNPILDNNTGSIFIGVDGGTIPEPAGMAAALPAVALLRRRRR